MRLSSFDLMVAKTYEPGWNLRDKFSETKLTYPILEAFLEDDGMPILLAISLEKRENVRQSSVLALPKPVVHDLWDTMSGRLSAAAEFMNELGIYCREEMPYSNMLSLFAALLGANYKNNAGNLLKKWFWYSSLTNALDVAANTRIVSHYRALAKGHWPTSFEGSDPTFVHLGLATRKSERAIWFSYLAYARINVAAQFDKPQQLVPAFLFDEDDLIGANLIHEDISIDVRGAINMVLVPPGSAAVVRRMNAKQMIDLAARQGWSELLDKQICGVPVKNASELISARLDAFGTFLRDIGLSAEPFEENHAVLVLKHLN